LAQQVRNWLNSKAETLHDVPDGCLAEGCFRISGAAVGPRFQVPTVKAGQPVAMGQLKSFLYAHG
jgi:hypothetical protein